MRKLLVASQKSGVGKTTASVNLAAAAARAGARVLLLDADPLSSISTALNLAHHPRRRPLRDAGVELPGVLVSGVVPGLDIVSPYDDGCCADEDLDNVLKVLASPDFAERCGCLIVGAPPFGAAGRAQPGADAPPRHRQARGQAVGRQGHGPRRHDAGAPGGVPGAHHQGARRLDAGERTVTR